MTIEEQQELIAKRRRALFLSLTGAVTDFEPIKQIAAARIAQYGQRALVCEPEELGKIQGMAEEARFWLNIKDRAREEIDRTEPDKQSS